MAHTAVYGIYSTRQDAEMAIDAMRAAGFRAGDISVLFPENHGTKDIGHEKHTKAPEKATAGAAFAGIAGGTLGWLAGIGALAIPGIGPFVAAGPIMAALAGLGAGSVVGGLAGALIGAGIPEYEAKRYEGRIRSGGILLSVHCEDDILIGRAKELLRHTGAEDIAAAAEGRVRGGSAEVDEHRTTHAIVDERPVRDDTHATHFEPRVSERIVEEDNRPVSDTRRVVRGDIPPTSPVIEHRVSDRIVVQDERPSTDTRRVVHEERVLTEEEIRRRREAGEPPPTELL